MEEEADRELSPQAEAPEPQQLASTAGRETDSENISGDVVAGQQVRITQLSTKSDGTQREFGTGVPARNSWRGTEPPDFSHIAPAASKKKKNRRAGGVTAHKENLTNCFYLQCKYKVRTQKSTLGCSK